MNNAQNKNKNNIMLDYFLQEEKNRVMGKMNQSKKTFYKYNYDCYEENKQYSYKDFSYVDKTYNNHNKLTNYECMGYNSNNYLTIPKIVMQALGTLQTIYLAELSRFSIYKPINRFGFFQVSKKEIEKDTGITPRIQDRLCKQLEGLGIITSNTYKKEMRKFYRFNDDVMLNIYFDIYKGTWKRIKYNKNNPGDNNEK